VFTPLIVKLLKDGISLSSFFLLNKSSSPRHIKTNEGHYDTNELAEQPPRPPNEREDCLIYFLNEVWGRLAVLPHHIL